MASGTSQRASSRTTSRRIYFIYFFSFLCGLLLTGEENVKVAAQEIVLRWTRPPQSNVVDFIYRVGALVLRLFVASYGSYALMRDLALTNAKQSSPATFQAEAVSVKE